MTVFNPTKAGGTHFYKYQSAEHLEWLKPIILDHQLYVPSVGQLNDPADCRPRIKPMSEDEQVTFLKKNDYLRRHPVVALDDLREYESGIRKVIEIEGLEWFQRKESEILNSKMEGFRVYSLTKRYDNLSLWAKYAANHTGYCLEFANVGPLFGEYVFEVIYRDYAPFDLNDSEGRDAGFLVCKRPEWSNEEEVRLISARGTPPLVKIEPEWLTPIILGKDMTEENKQQIQAWAKERKPELFVVNAYFDGLNQSICLKNS